MADLLERERGNVSERRTSQRTSVALPLTVHTNGQVGAVELLARSRDVSIGNLYFEANGEFDVGALIEFVLTLPGEVTTADDVKICCHGRVVRVDRHDHSCGVLAQSYPIGRSVVFQRNGVIQLVPALPDRPPDGLFRSENNDPEFKNFLTQYVSKPLPAAITCRSSIREDGAIREIVRLLSGQPNHVINVLDICCGRVPLAKRLLESLGGQVPRIAYWAIDRDSSCIENIRAEQEKFRSFHAFNLLQREAWDLTGLPARTFDLVALINSMHEIYPRNYPKLFSTFNTLLTPSCGQIYISDVELLPPDSPESGAIAFSGAEVQTFLSASGYTPEMTTHRKQVPVYQVHLKYSPDGVNKKAMLKEITKVVKIKLNEASALRKQIAPPLFGGTEEARQWLILTGSIARYVEEIIALRAL